ncbi:hypothetical protein G7K_0163-t1 [Saitoella complicata NRRL Y-17804]|uniref:glutamine--tRNA ligase n=1 Tax=Saitoella complicata (strain BCRC 22490 / CBS 7301 / JCM 7358 / NBRC 10748 / NRRL Y-17804) TaxID=698492 RepID=A0A0E9N7N7_SAICN|nr:hypothetical protein G7K_0163-t1 [Saitoella complicata NRRL Y-17804]
MADDIVKAFAAIGLSDAVVKETVKNTKLSSALTGIIAEAGVTDGCDKAIGSLLYALATADKSGSLPNREYVSLAIKDGRLKTVRQVEAAIAYMKQNAGSFNEHVFNKDCGVGVEVTTEEVKTLVAAYIQENKEVIESERYQRLSATMVALRANPDLKWADATVLKKEIDLQFGQLLGPKDERDAPKKKVKKPAASKEAKTSTTNTAKTAASAEHSGNMFEEGFLARLYKPGENPQIKPELREQHLRATGGKVVTRFPPEPNGYLHIGHSKAIAVNFGYAKYHNGICYLRYDDTNPEAEEEQYFVSIKEMVNWLGFKPYKITYSSDYFQELYDLAEELIKRDKAYVCHCTAEEMYAARGGDERGPRYACKHRNRPIDDSLAEFRGMNDGKYQPNQAILRMKQDLEDGNPQMWDMVAYRVLDAPHHRTGDKWKIYPTYDFTHCLVDSFENISHSLCTTEFITARQSYEWLCDALEVYKPKQSEYGRLNITGTVLSKRKIAKLVTEKHVRGWDDPRLYTLVAIKRRGIPPGAILNFVNELGVTTSTTNIQTARFENSIRRYLEDHTPRLMVLLDPVPVIIDNLPDDYVEECTVPYKPNDPTMGERKVPFAKRVYIDRSDFRTEDSKDYFRLAPGKSVGLFRVPYPIKATSFKTDPATGLVTEIHAHYENDAEFKKPKTYIQWVGDAPSHKSPVILDEVRLFTPLFKSENPSAHPDGFLADIDPNSEQIVKNAMVEVGITDMQKRGTKDAGEQDEQKRLDGPEAIRFQAMRVGYFCMDSDSSEGRVVLNRIVSLKEDVGKRA